MMKIAVALVGFSAAVAMFVVGLTFSLNYDSLKDKAEIYEGKWGLESNLYKRDAGYAIMATSWFCGGATGLYLREVKE